MRRRPRRSSSSARRSWLFRESRGFLASPIPNPFPISPLPALLPTAPRPSAAERRFGALLWRALFFEGRRDAFPGPFPVVAQGIDGGCAVRPGESRVRRHDHGQQHLGRRRERRPVHLPRGHHRREHEHGLRGRGDRVRSRHPRGGHDSVHHSRRPEFKRLLRRPRCRRSPKPSRSTVTHSRARA